MITEWAPIHLARVLKDWFWKGGAKDASALNVWQQSCQQLYLPRLRDATVFQNTLNAGAGSHEFFGHAQGKEDGHYLGFGLGQRISPILDASLLLIEPQTARAYWEARRAAEEVARPQPTGAAGGMGQTPPQVVAGSAKPTDPAGGATPQTLKRHFYASIELDPFLAKKQFADLVDEVVQQFTICPGVRVKIAIEIHTESATGFDDGLQRAVKENCGVLRFKNAEFEGS